MTLTAAQVTDFKRNGFLVLPGFVRDPWLASLRQVTQRFVEESRVLTTSDRRFDLEPDHSNASPRLRRLINPVGQDETYWDFATSTEMLDLAEAIIGHDIKFHHGKLNFKFQHGGEEVKWHQDIQFWPHTNYDLITIGVYLEDVLPGQGEMGFIPGSHNGELYDQYQGEQWTGYISEVDLQRIDTSSAVFPTGPAGTVTVHSCRMIHGSSPNNSARWRPLLLQTYAAADAFAYTDLVRRAPHGEELVRGKAAKWARHDPRPCQVPPTRVGTIFQAQQNEPTM